MYGNALTRYTVYDKLYFKIAVDKLMNKIINFCRTTRPKILKRVTTLSSF